MNFCQIERHEVAIYLKALWLGDQVRLDKYEGFGNTPHHFQLHKRMYDKAVLFGFTSKEPDENGWLKRSEFLEEEHIIFIHREGWAAGNYITIGKGLNGKWPYGASHSIFGWRLWFGRME